MDTQFIMYKFDSLLSKMIIIFHNHSSSYWDFFYLLIT